MDPITFVLWVWLTWGVGRVFLRDDPSGTTTVANPPVDAHDVGDHDDAARPTVRERATGWVRRLIDRADANAEQVRRTDWGNTGWWLRALLAAAWMPARDVRYGARWAKAKVRPTSEDVPEAAAPDVDDDTARPSGDEPSDRGRTGERQQPGHDEPRDRQRGDQQDCGEGSRRYDDPPCGDVDYEVEVVGTTPNTPRQGQLPRPVPQLEAADEPTTPEPAHTDTSTDEGNQDMAGQYVAIPGATSPATRGQFAPATTTGNGDTHADAKEFARQIVQAMERTADPVDQAAEMLRVCVLAAWEKVDRLQAVGIGGRVLEEWGDAVILFETAKRTSLTLVQQVTDARQAAAKARSRQVAVGDRIEDVVTAAGKSAANHTSYYGKQ